MKYATVDLVPLDKNDREQFILDNQKAFKFGAMKEFGLRDQSLDADGEIISRKTIEQSIDCVQNETYRIFYKNKCVGGVVLKIDKESNENHLELLFVSPEEHGKGIGYGAWMAIEKMHPETKVWKTCTPYFEKRNIHFYINKCGFSAVEFICEFHKASEHYEEHNDGPDEMFTFQKVMNKKDCF